jgi:hypothetical protein
MEKLTASMSGIIPSVHAESETILQGWSRSSEASSTHACLIPYTALDPILPKLSSDFPWRRNSDWMALMDGESPCCHLQTFFANSSSFSPVECYVNENHVIG